MAGHFWASPMGRPPVPFRMVEGGAAARRVRQSGARLPGALVYWREGEELLARIEGTLRDKPAAIEWRFARGTAEDCPKAP